MKAKKTCYIKGSFKGKNLAHHILLRIDERDYSGNLAQIEYPLNGNESFEFSFQVERFQKIKLVYTRNELEIFVEPGDTIFIDIDPMNFVFNSSLRGNNGIKNNILQFYYENNQCAKRRSDRLQFKYGNLWYHSNTIIDRWMRSMEEQAFLLKMGDRKNQWFQYLIEKQLDHPEVFQGDLLAYLESEINYNWAYFMLIYGTTYSARHSLPENYLDFLKDVSLSDAYVHCPSFRRYVFAYLNALYEQSDKSVSYLIGMHALASQLLEGEIKAWFLSELFLKTLKNRDDPSFIDLYYDFINENPFLPYSNRVVKKFQEFISLSTGSAAPDFKLISSDNLEKKLVDYRGKKTLINFWASWCKPCLSKLPKLRVLEKSNEEELNLVMLNIDKDVSSWRMVSDQYKIPGDNLYVPADKQSDLMNAFGVKFLPGLILLDENGRFDVSPHQLDLDRIEEHF
jgi:thiol-disulfide isomerase/thioredoxin